jgi:hypothetical protein
MARLEPAARLPTIWTTPDDLWEHFILPLLREHDPEPRTGRPRIDQRKAFDGVIRSATPVRFVVHNFSIGDFL